MKTPLDDLREIHTIQGMKGNWDSNDYMFGMFNAFELALSLFENRKVQYRERPANFPKSHLSDCLKITLRDCPIGLFVFWQDKQLCAKISNSQFIVIQTGTICLVMENENSLVVRIKMSMMERLFHGEL